MNNERHLIQPKQFTDTEKAAIKAYVDKAHEVNPDLSPHAIFSVVMRDPNALANILQPKIDISDDEAVELMDADMELNTRRRQTGSQAIVSAQWQGNLGGESLKIGALTRER